MIEKELQRVDKTAMKSLEQKDVLFLYPQSSKRNTSMLVLKKPKTESSIRRVFIRRPLPTSLRHGSASRSTPRRLSVGEYTDYNLILANGLGHPMGTDAHHCTFERVEKSLIHKKQRFRHQSVAAEENLREPGPVKILSAIVGSL